MSKDMIGWCDSAYNSYPDFHCARTTFEFVDHNLRASVAMQSSDCLFNFSARQAITANVKHIVRMVGNECGQTQENYTKACRLFCDVNGADYFNHAIAGGML